MRNTLTKILVTVLNFGVVLASTHNVLVPGTNFKLSQPDFVAKVHTDLHTHFDHISTHSPMRDRYVDPKSLRRVRSEADKTAERDLQYNGWEVYDGWTGLSC